MKNKYKYLILLLLSLVLVGCYKKYPKGSLFSNKIFIEYALYNINGREIPISDIEKFINLNYPRFNILNEPDFTIDKTQMILTKILDVKEEYPPPAIESLHYFSEGLSEKEKMLLIENTNEAIIFDIFTSNNDIWNLNKELNILLYEISKKFDCLIWDSNTRICFSSESFKVKRIENWINEIPNITDQIIIHYYKNGKFYREITLGMNKFGLPDVVVNDLTANISNSVLSLINLTCQTLAEQGHIAKTGELYIDINNIRNNILKNILLDSCLENANKNFTLNIGIGKSEAGDPDNQLLEIIFNNFLNNKTQFNQQQTISTLFGYKEDNVISIKHEEALIEASKKAKENLPKLKLRFNNGLNPGEYLLVKLPFSDISNQNEWMWVEVIEWKKDIVSGILENDPQIIKTLKAGDKVNRKEEDIFDYILYFPDGTYEGNETGKILQNSQ